MGVCVEKKVSFDEATTTEKTLTTTTIANPDFAPLHAVCLCRRLVDVTMIVCRPTTTFQQHKYTEISQ